MSVPVVRWIAQNLVDAVPYFRPEGEPIATGTSWPTAAFNIRKGRHLVAVSEYPVDIKQVSIKEFVDEAWSPLSKRATNGFTRRARSGRLRFPEGFLDLLDVHADRMQIAVDK